jgi:2-dehydro-3-deoxygluconokinase
MAEVVTLGECLVSLIGRTPGPLAEAATLECHVAGAEANVAVGLERLGHHAAFIGRVGTDGFGTAIVRKLRGEGVDVRPLAIDEAAPTGIMVRERRAIGPADVIYLRRGSAGSRLDRVDVDAAAEAGIFDGARWLHVTGITPALSPTCRSAVDRAVELARARDLVVSLDVNLRRKLWSDAEAAPVLRALARSADVILGSPDELAVIVDLPVDSPPADIVAAIVALGPSIAVMKLGAGGAIAIGAGNSPIASPALAVPVVVDVVGAGDAFTAGFIASDLDGPDPALIDLERALANANACGAAAVASMGDQSGMPDRVELGRLLREGFDTIR